MQPPEGRTPGDLRAMLVTLKPFLAQEWDGGKELGNFRFFFGVFSLKKSMEQW